MCRDTCVDLKVQSSPSCACASLVPAVIRAGHETTRARACAVSSLASLASRSLGSSI